MPAKQRLMKDGINRHAINRIKAALSQIIPEFNATTFEKTARKDLDTLEMRARVIHVINALHTSLNIPYPEIAQALHQLPTVWDFGDPDDRLQGFAAWPLIDYISVHGLAHPQESLSVLETLTPLFTAEFALRPFYLQHYDLTYQTVLSWLAHPNHHVRRLASEGSRPRLPWGTHLKRFIEDPQPLIPILDKLMDDPSRYVQKSVANSLNDISKDHPELVIELGSQWLGLKSNQHHCHNKNPAFNPNNRTKNNTRSATNAAINSSIDHKGGDRAWIIKHASRTLVKAGHLDAITMLGYTRNPKCLISDFKLDNHSVSIGDHLNFSFTLISKSREAQKIIIDYAIHFMRANGKANPKVFKLKSFSLNGSESHNLAKSHTFKAVTTRKYYPGTHTIEIFLNGTSILKENFDLLKKLAKKH